MSIIPIDNNLTPTNGAFKNETKHYTNQCKIDNISSTNKEVLYIFLVSYVKEVLLLILSNDDAKL